MGPIKILLVDDHLLVRKGFRALLDEMDGVQIIGEASNGMEAIMLLRNGVKPEVVLLDYEMPVMNGLEAATVIIREFFGVKVIMLTMLQDKSLIEAAVAAGVRGFLFKNTSLEDLSNAIDKVASGEVWFGSDVTLTLLNQKSHPVDHVLALLSDREKEILKLVAKGMTSVEIGQQLFISPRTVDTHRNNIIQKLDVNGIPGLVQFAIHHKLI
ncbi:MAG: response regulator transcription factor [Saprospiraceae bacterium]|jgi:DNA-binding NarL/FixJ family response regulator|nr:response regulator transcription factor [Candidatus Parvibacillus calidus]MCB0591532.1 response regulator transcription factor [Saprospiraceae bacterium]HMY83623.1 response regulator transcription factor [Saprospiraceae bacterium]HNK20775.1 response regulator transcription factor [Saprospiraceae bacterium]HPE09705.1 response regulator transcription factor [Saprospiraceae bacterium]